jgi:hypothetical protein
MQGKGSYRRSAREHGSLFDMRRHWYGLSRARQILEEVKVKVLMPLPPVLKLKKAKGKDGVKNAVSEYCMSTSKVHASFLAKSRQTAQHHEEELCQAIQVKN